MTTPATPPPFTCQQCGARVVAPCACDECSLILCEECNTRHEGEEAEHPTQRVTLPTPVDPEDDDAHDLMPAWLAARVPPLYAQEQAADPLVYVKYFTPDSSWTWYLTEYDAEEEVAFGFVCGLEEELGYFSLAEMREVSGLLGLPVERDLYFTPAPLSVVRAKHP